MLCIVRFQLSISPHKPESVLQLNLVRKTRTFFLIFSYFKQEKSTFFAFFITHHFSFKKMNSTAEIFQTEAMKQLKFFEITDLCIILIPNTLVSSDGEFSLKHNLQSIGWGNE